jgi:hypothetical protein
VSVGSGSGPLELGDGDGDGAELWVLLDGLGVADGDGSWVVTGRDAAAAVGRAARCPAA